MHYTHAMCRWQLSWVLILMPESQKNGDYNNFSKTTVGGSQNGCMCACVCVLDAQHITNTLTLSETTALVAWSPGWAISMLKWRPSWGLPLTRVLSCLLPLILLCLLLPVLATEPRAVSESLQVHQTEGIKHYNTVFYIWYSSIMKPWYYNCITTIAYVAKAIHFSPLPHTWEQKQTNKRERFKLLTKSSITYT